MCPIARPIAFNHEIKVSIIPSKIDFKRKLKDLYLPSSKEVSIVQVPKMRFLMIKGKGSPGDSQEYKDALQALYPVAYKAKFLNKSKGKDYVVPPLEGLWWAEDMSDFSNGKRDKWEWYMMIMQPEWISEDLINKAIDITENKKPELKELLPKLQFEEFDEGKVAQIMHLGPYSEEGPTIEKLHTFIKEHEGEFDGHKHKHHEIYIGDPRRGKPENLRTVIRQPFR
jgi:hypothetical protein